MLRLLFQIIRIDIPVFSAMLGMETGVCAYTEKVSCDGDTRFLLTPMILQRKKEAGEHYQFF